TAYNTNGHAALDPNTAAGSASGFGGFDFSSMDFSDIFSDLFGGGFGGSSFGGFGGFGGRRSGPRRGADIRVQITISFDEAINGCEKEISLRYKDDCPIATEVVQRKVHRQSLVQSVAVEAK
ncbi:MAG: hypothetical protein MJ151_00600, partial [Lachnospiraceae bacterium]|nr:hypothetical protein [Lachnospiraceae bacterium]